MGLVNSLTLQEKLSYALITGASSGIGYELALVFAENKYNVILIARREERLNHLARELEENYKVRAHILIRDLSQPQSVQEIYDWIKKNDIQVELLVNNAGFVVYGNISDTPWDDEQKICKLKFSRLLRNLKFLLLNFGVQQKSPRIP